MPKNWLKSLAASILGLTSGMTWAAAARAEISDEIVRIGVFQEAGEQGALAAAQLALDDFGGGGRNIRTLLIPVESPGQAASAVAIAKQWLEIDKVDAIVGDLNAESSAAVNEALRNTRMTFLATSTGDTDLTGASCSPNLVQWAPDIWTIVHATAAPIVRYGGNTWYFLGADQDYWRNIQAQARANIEKEGGKVVGSAEHPAGESDLAFPFAQAKANKARIIGLFNDGSDLASVLKQARSSNIDFERQRVAAFSMSLDAVSASGLATTQGVIFANSFYWDLNDRTRAFTARFAKKMAGKPPSAQDATVYSAVLTYLRAVADSEGDDSNAVMPKMKVNFFRDPLFGEVTIRQNGRAAHNMYLFQVKRPEESRYPYDYYKIVASIPAEVTFRPVEESGCRLVGAPKP